MSGRPVLLDMVIFETTENLVSACQRSHFTRDRARMLLLRSTLPDFQETRAAVFDMIWPVGK